MPFLWSLGRAQELHTAPDLGHGALGCVVLGRVALGRVALGFVALGHGHCDGPTRASSPDSCCTLFLLL